MERNGMEYEIVGGIAVSGEYKTRDVDMILLMDEGDAEALEEALRRARFSVRAGDMRALREFTSRFLTKFQNTMWMRRLRTRKATC